jgi:hypothetical protein
MTTANNGHGPDDTLQYGILGEDTASALEKLEKYTGVIDWAYLKPHFESGALIYVDPSLSLTEVGHAFTTDDAVRVAEWRKAGDLVTPSHPHGSYWAESGTTFLALVVSPFVLIQPLVQS